MSRSAIAVVLILFASSAIAGPLHDAARVGEIDRANALIDAGEDVDGLDEFGETPLIRSILDGQAAVAMLLLDRGAAVNARNRGGFTALHAAAYAGTSDVAEALIARGADIDDRENKAGVSPLSVAAEEGRADVARVLIDHGANLELAELNGYTPLTRAIWRGQREVIALLQGAGARCQPVEILEEPAYSDCLAGQK